MIKNIRICKLPYQEHPFVHGTRIVDGKDVWLTNEGAWTTNETDPRCNIPLVEGLVIHEDS